MIFVDMDGVMADFDEHYKKLFGIKPTRWPDEDNIDWDLVRSVPDFYLTMPTMPDVGDLVRGLRDRVWAILTGCPKEVDQSKNQKRDWAKINWPAISVTRERPAVLCCRSREKYEFALPGDVLIDDYLKYRPEWERAGGIFIHHTSAAKSLAQLARIERERT